MNRELLAKAEEEGFEVFVTTDKNLRNQQNPSRWRIAIIVLSSTSWPRIRTAATSINQAIETTLPESLNAVSLP